MKPTKALFAVKIGAADWEEQLITEVESRIEGAIAWAKANGFDRLRIVEVDGRKPDFAGTVRK